MPRGAVGTVYVIASERYPGAVKVGRTNRDMAFRLAEISATPGYRGFGPWRVVHLQPTPYPVEVERAAAQTLRRLGVKITLRLGCRELYRVPEVVATDIVRHAAATVAWVKSKRRRKKALLRVVLVAAALCALGTTALG